MSNAIGPRDMARIAKALEGIGKELERIRKNIERKPSFVKCSALMSRSDFEKIMADLKEQSENIVLLPPGTEYAGPCKSDHDHDGGEWIDITEGLTGGYSDK